MVRPCRLLRPTAAGLLLAVLLISITSAAGADDDPRVEWLRRHAVPVAGIDPGMADFRDLAALREVLAGVRVVLLGEAGQGDGSTLLAKTTAPGR